MTDDKQRMKELEDIVATLSKKLKDIVERFDDHAVQFAGSESAPGGFPHPYQKVYVAEYGLGLHRIDPTGIQILGAGSVTETPALYFTPEFDENPQGPHSSPFGQASLSGKADDSDPADVGSSVTMEATAVDEDTNQVTTHVRASANARSVGPQPIPRIEMSMRFNGLIGLMELEYASNQTAYRVSFTQDRWMLQLPRWATADPSGSVNDGTIIYRLDTDKYRARANNAWRNLAVENSVIVGSGSELTIASGVVTATTGYHIIDTQADAATDDLDTINGTVAGQLYVFRVANSARDVVFKDGTGNLKLAGDFTADNIEDTITMVSDGTNLYELARSGNGT